MTSEQYVVQSLSMGVEYKMLNSNNRLLALTLLGGSWDLVCKVTHTLIGLWVIANWNS